MGYQKELLDLFAFYESKIGVCRVECTHKGGYVLRALALRDEYINSVATFIEQHESTLRAEIEAAKAEIEDRRWAMNNDVICYECGDKTWAAFQPDAEEGTTCKEAYESTEIEAIRALREQVKEPPHD